MDQWGGGYRIYIYIYGLPQDPHLRRCDPDFCFVFFWLVCVVVFVWSVIMNAFVFAGPFGWEGGF